MKKADVLLLFASISLSIVLMEIGLRAFTVFPIHDNLNISPHPSLGHTLNSKLNDTDHNGFRNPKNMDRNAIDIIAIGDSHTQGFNVSYEQSWPAVLARTTNKKVYNYGIGGYGFVHYAYLLDTELADTADTIIVALYPANDIRPGICSQVTDSFYQTLIDKKLVTLPCSYQATLLRNKPVTLANWLTTHSAVASIIKHFADKYYIETNEYHDISGHLIKKSRAANHHRITDLSVAEINHNFQSTIRILKRSHQTHKKLGVLLIPSKSRVLHDWAIKHGIDIPNDFNASNEARLMAKFTDVLNQSNIAVVDATQHTLSAFERNIKTNERFYPDNDGHPLASGYHAYADAALELLHLINRQNQFADL